MSLLTIIQAACSRLAIPVPTAVVSSTNSQVMQLYALANEEIQECTFRFPWTKIREFQTFSTLNQLEQTGALSSDFDEQTDYIIPETMWDRTTVRKVFGPLTPEQWENERAFPVYTPIAPAFMVQNATLYLTPAPAAGDTLAFEICVQKGVRSSASAKQVYFQADTDTSIFGDPLTTKGVVWRFKKMKGLDYSDEFQSYENMINVMYARDGARPRLNLAYGLNRRLLYPANIPIGSWPSS